MSKFKNIAIITAIVVGIVISFALPFLIKVKTECRSQYGECPQDLETGIKKQDSVNLFQTKKNISKYLKSNFLVSDFSTQFKLPNILFVNVLIKKPSFILKNDVNQTVSVGQNGRILGIGDNAALPVVIVTGNLKKIGEEVDANHLFALNLAQGISEMYQINVGRIQDDTLVVELPTSIKVIFPMDGDVQTLLGSLRLVYSKIENEKDPETSSGQRGKYKEIDLRFKNPVLR